MQALGVFENIYGAGAEMGIGQTLLISVVGFAVVFIVLGFLAIFVFCMGKVFDILQSKKESKEKAAVVTPATAVSTASPEGTPLPSNQSIGDLTLINCTEEEAAVIMAVTSAKSGIPLNRLKFNTIKCLEDNE
ncbi:MAG: OadG family protein [Clostridia bacterium]|nr:OadG family protein [Clostridia bacterium]